jgi:hypothetical protein
MSCSRYQNMPMFLVLVPPSNFGIWLLVPTSGYFAGL